MNLTPAVGIDINAKQEAATAICFNPLRNIINLASGNEVFVCDISSKHVIARISIDSEPTATITHLYHTISHNFLVAATDGGSIYVWEMNRRTLVSEHHDVERKPVVCITGSPMLPIVFFSRASSKDVTGIDLRPANIGSSNVKFKGSKKNVLSVACHPTKHILAGCGADGVVRVWDYQSQRELNTLDDVVSYETTRAVTPGDKYVIAFEPRENSRLVCVGNNGLVLGWTEIWEQPRVVISCQLKMKSKVVNIAYHPTQPILMILTANGSVTGWEVWQNELQAAGYLPEFSLLPHETNKCPRLPSYAQRPTINSAPTHILAHPSAKYFTFQWDNGVSAPGVPQGPSIAAPLTQSHSSGALSSSLSLPLPTSPSAPNLVKSNSLNLSSSPSASFLVRSNPSIPASATRAISTSTSSSFPRPILSSSPTALAHRPTLTSSTPLKLIHANSASTTLPTSPLSASPNATPQSPVQSVGSSASVVGAQVSAGAGGAAPAAPGVTVAPAASQHVKRLTVRHLVYTHTDIQQPLSTLPFFTLLQPQLGFYYDEKQNFNFPKDVVYYDNHAAMAHYFIKGVSVKLADLPPPKGDTARDLVRPVRFVYSPKQQSYMVFYEVTRGSLGESFKCLISCPNLGFPAQYEVAQDGVFLGKEEDEMLLLVGGGFVHVAPVSFLEWRIHKLETNVARVFKTPLGEGKIVMYFDKKEKRLILSHPTTYQPDPSKGSLPLLDGEHVIQVVWQGDALAAVLTTSRLVIINANLGVIAQVKERPVNYPPITSVIWLEWVLLYTTDTHLKYMTLDGKVFTLRSLDRDKLVLLALLPDRVMYCYRNYAGVPDTDSSSYSYSSSSLSVSLSSSSSSSSLMAPTTPTNPTNSMNFAPFGVGVGGWGGPGLGLGGCTSVHNHAVGLLEPLLMGLFAPPNGIAVSHIRKKIAFVISRFDTGRVTKRVLDRLLETGHPDAAFQLAENSTRYAADFRFTLAFNAKFFEKALSIASAEYEKSKDARYRARLLAVGQASMEAKKFELSKKAFELASDTLALLHLYVVANYKTGLIALRKSAEEQADKFTTVLIDNLLTKVQDKNISSSDPLSIPNLYTPTIFINVSMRMGGEFLSPLNLNSLSRWLTTSNAATISAISFQQVAAAPIENKDKDKDKDKQDPSLVPPKRFGSLRANQQKLSSKTTLSSSSTLRRTPSSERVVSLPPFLKKPLEELLIDDTDTRETKGEQTLVDHPPAHEKPRPSQHRLTPSVPPLPATISPSQSPRSSTPPPPSSREQPLPTTLLQQPFKQSPRASTPPALSSTPPSSFTPWSVPSIQSPRSSTPPPQSSTPSPPSIQLLVPSIQPQQPTAESSQPFIPPPRSPTPPPSFSQPSAQPLPLEQVESSKLTSESSPEPDQPVHTEPEPVLSSSPSHSTPSSIPEQSSDPSPPEPEQPVPSSTPSDLTPPPSTPEHPSDPLPSKSEQPDEPEQPTSSPSVSEHLTPSPSEYELPTESEPSEPKPSDSEPNQIEPEPEQIEPEPELRPSRPKRTERSGSFVDGFDNPFGTIISPSVLSATPPYFSSFPPPLPMSYIALTFEANSTSFSSLGSLSQATQAQLQAATDNMKQALLALEKGLYDESLNDVITASRLLASVANPALTRRELRLCVAYALALRMLRRLKELDRSAALTDAALLSKLLAAVPIQPRHRVVVMRMAVNKNMLVGNYDSAAKILELLLTLELPDELMLSNKWRVCCERGFVDAVPSSDDTKLCFLELKTHGEDSTVCPLCFATFSEAAAPTGSQCPYCSHGNLQLEVSPQVTRQVTT